MPCYDPPLAHEEKRPSFLAEALCHLAQFATPNQLEGVPGLAEWKRRHDYIDTNGDGSLLGAMDAGDAYDKAQGRDAWDGPLYMELWLAEHTDEEATDDASD